MAGIRIEYSLQDLLLKAAIVGATEMLKHRGFPTGAVLVVEVKRANGDSMGSSSCALTDDCKHEVVSDGRCDRCGSKVEKS